MTYETQEEYEYFEGAMEQSVPPMSPRMYQHSDCCNKPAQIIEDENPNFICTGCDNVCMVH